MRTLQLTVKLSVRDQADDFDVADTVLDILASHPGDEYETVDEVDPIRESSTR